MGLDEETDAEAVEASKPWYEQGAVGKITLTVAGALILGAITWSASMLMAASDARDMAERNREKIEKVEDEQVELKEEVLPAIEKVGTKIEGLRDSFDKFQKNHHDDGR